MTADRRRMMEAATRLWQARPAGAAVLRPGAFRAQAATLPAPPRKPGEIGFTLMFFSALAEDRPRPDLYEALHAAAMRADALGFRAMWLPERHFHPFGGPYPEPSVLAASLARATTRIRLRAGSVVLPLHHPVAVAERWAMVDTLSNGRVDIALGSGWNPRDFLLSPGTFADRGEVLHRRAEEIRRLWRGESVEFAGPDGQPVAARLLPRPIQPELPVWISSTGNPESFARAGTVGANVLTMLLGSELDDLAPKIARYRAARQAAGHDAGTVTLMLHAAVHEDGAMVCAAARDPFRAYVRNALDSQRNAHAAGRLLTPEQREQMTAFAAERYARGAALFGTPEDCAPLLTRIAEAGVDEIAALVDFGVPDALMLDSLPYLARLGASRHGIAAPIELRAPAFDAAQPVAIIGIAGRFPGAPDTATFWANLLEGRGALRPPPPGRGAALARGGFLDDVETFDAAGFGIAPAEAAAMDPHQRLMLEAVRAALLDAGIDPATLRRSDTAIFAALYSTSFAEHAARIAGDAADGVSIAGQLPSMAPNRISFLFDWSGPSELVNTACSSGLVAIHRAAAAIRAGECAVAVAAGASLLLSDAESAALARLGILSPGGTCRAFDRDANGQARGEGVGALVLKRLDQALADGDPIHAVLRGSAVNHAGARSGSLTLPSPRRQAACIARALHVAGVKAADIAYVEAHGAGTAAGDLAELSALEEALADAPTGGIAIGSVKPAIGSLDAAGGIAAAIKAVLMLRHGTIPPPALHPTPPDGFEPAESPLRFAPTATPWPSTARAVLVHAYGLGGVNADLVLAPAPVATTPRRAALPAAPATRTRFAVLPEAAPESGSEVAAFYDFVTRAEAVGDKDVFLTLAPLPAIVPGFSWTRTFQDPAANPAHWALMQAAQREMRDVLFAGVDFAQARRVLDIGCGLATDLMALAAQHPHLRATGCTISAAQAEAGRARVASRGLAARVAIHHRDSAGEAGFPGGPHDVVIGFEVAHHIRDKNALFRNIAATLARPQGRLLLADCVANTVAPIDLPEIGSFTPDRDSYAALLARHGLAIRDWLDISQEVANFLEDPELEDMLAAEADAAARAGRAGAMPLAAAVQRSWHGFGQALREGLVGYILVTAAPDPAASTAQNRAMMEAS